MMSVDLPPPETPVMQVKVPSGICADTFFRLLPRAPMTFSQRSCTALRRLRRHGNLLEADEIFAREAFGRTHDVFGRAFGDDVAAMDAGARAHVDHMIGGADRFFVMLDHEHGVAEIAQAFERFQKLCVVALVQADGRLVEHIQHAGQARTDLRGKADALALAARQRAGGAAKREIIQAHIVEEFQPRADFLQDARRDFPLLLVQLLVEIAKPGIGIA